MINNPFFSVIIPVFNTEKLLSRCIESVLNQTYATFEIIIVNDCSLGNCTEIINSYKDNRIKYIDKKENEGTHLARKSGVECANSEYCLFLDSDDYYELNALEEIHAFLSKNAVDLLEFGFKGFSRKSYNYVDTKESLLERCLKEETFKNHNIANKVIKTHIVKEAYSKMTDFYCNWFEDGYAYFIITTLCKTFDAIEKEFYVYDITSGITANENILTAKQFNLRVENIVKIKENLYSYLEKENLQKYKKIIKQIFTTQSKFLLNHYFRFVKDEEKKLAMKEMKNHFSFFLLNKYKIKAKIKKLINK